MNAPADFELADNAKTLRFSGSLTLAQIGTLHQQLDELEASPDRIDIGASDGFAVAAETGRWVGTATDDATRSAGRYLVHWTKASGAWRIVSETYIGLG